MPIRRFDPWKLCFKEIRWLDSLDSFAIILQSSICIFLLRSRSHLNGQASVDYWVQELQNKAACRSCQDAPFRFFTKNAPGNLWNESRAVHLEWLMIVASRCVRGQRDVAWLLQPISSNPSISGPKNRWLSKTKLDLFDGDSARSGCEHGIFFCSIHRATFWLRTHQSHLLRNWA